MSIGKQIREFLKISEVFLRRPYVDVPCNDCLAPEGAGNARSNLCMPYALRAFEAGALDYIFETVGRSELQPRGRARQRAAARGTPYESSEPA